MPAWSDYILSKGYDAESALTKFRACKAGANAEGVTAITVAGETGRGVSQFDVSTAEIAQGKGASVAIVGTTPWEAGAAIAIDALVTVDSVGRCVTAGSGDKVWGQCRLACDASGDIVSVTLNAVKTTF